MFLIVYRWTDGSFTDLNSETVEGECEEFWREIYKIQKQFNNLIKKRKLELQTKLSEKRKSKSRWLFKIPLKTYSSSYAFLYFFI